MDLGRDPFVFFQVAVIERQADTSFAEGAAMDASGEMHQLAVIGSLTEGPAEAEKGGGGHGPLL